jgi:PAS domain S-box-containing protein
MSSSQLLLSEPTMELQSADSINRFREENPNPILCIKSDGTVLYSNPAAALLMQSNDPPGKVNNPWLKLIQETLAENSMGSVEIVNNQRTYFFKLVPVKKEDYVNAYGSDITDFRQSERRTQLLATALESTAHAVVITDRNGAIIWTNPAFTRLTGYESNDVIEKTPRILKSGQHSQAFYKDLWDTILAGKVWHGMFVNRHKDGSHYHDEHTITPVSLDGQKITHFVCVMNDVSERLKAEEQLRQSQKLNAIGQLAGGVAHDFNNLLTVINGRSQLLLNRLSAEDKTREGLELILKAGERAANLTRQLLAFSQRQILQPKLIDLNVIIMDLEKMLSRLLRENIDLSIIYGAQLKLIFADPGQIEQVLLTLVINARDAMPKGGSLKIETANAELTESQCATLGDVKPGKYALTTVSDTGAGMDDATKQRIFEPFYSTKEPGQGTGLGLSTIFGIVKQTGGHITFGSKLGIGTSFKIYLPHATDMQAKGSGDNLAAIRDGKEVILVAEDDELIRELIREILELNGFTVLLAENGKEALQVCEIHNRTINLVISDIVMPQIGGAELYERLKVTHPRLKVLFTSAYYDKDNVNNEVVSKGAGFIQKPFTAVGLLRKVREILAK